MVIRQYSYHSILRNAFVGIESVPQLEINFRSGERRLRTFISGWLVVLRSRKCWAHFSPE